MPFSSEASSVQAHTPSPIVDVVDWAMVQNVRTQLQAHRSAGDSIVWSERALTFCCEFTIETTDASVARDVASWLSYLPRGHFYLPV